MGLEPGIEEDVFEGELGLEIEGEGAGGRGQESVQRGVIWWGQAGIELRRTALTRAGGGGGLAVFLAEIDGGVEGGVVGGSALEEELVGAEPKQCADPGIRESTAGGGGRRGWRRGRHAQQQGCR